MHALCNLNMLASIASFVWNVTNVKFSFVCCFSHAFHQHQTTVYADGSICLDILQNRWSPTYDVSAILTSIQSLLDEPNPNSPANSLAAQLYQENRREYEKRVAAIVEQSWLNFTDEEEKESKKSTSTSSTSATSMTDNS